MSQQMLQPYSAGQQQEHYPAQSARTSMPAQTASSYATAEQNQAVNPANELIRIVTPLMTLITQIRHTVSHPNVAALRSQMIEEIDKAVRQLSEAGYPKRTIVATRYTLCTAIDEAVLSQTWGTQSIWVSGSLLSIFQRETWGGKRFYIILDDALRDARNNIDFIEYMYFLLSLGFEGEYYGDEGRRIREEIRNKVFSNIRRARMKPERNLSVNWKNSVSTENLRRRKARLRKVGWFTLVAMFVLALFYNIRAYHIASPTIKELKGIAKVEPVTTFGQIIDRPIIIRKAGEE